jgi:hypothetical protein
LLHCTNFQAIPAKLRYYLYQHKKEIAQGKEKVMDDKDVGELWAAIQDNKQGIDWQDRWHQSPGDQDNLGMTLRDYFEIMANLIRKLVDERALHYYEWIGGDDWDKTGPRHTSRALRDFGIDPKTFK